MSPKTNVTRLATTDIVPARSQYILLNPGPCNTSPGVKQALLRADVCHRDDEYSEDIARVASKLGKVFHAGPRHEVLVITGSGTAAMEAGIASSVPVDGKILVIDNGAFGERLAEIARLHEMNLVHLKYEHGQEVDTADVRAALLQHPDIAVVAMCHHETSVGLLNPVTEVGAMCREFDVLLLVDAVSSLGAEDLDVVRDNIDVCWSSSNKCLHGAAGVSFLCVSPRTWAKVASVKPRVFYLDMKKYRTYMREKSQTPFTPAVGTIYALEAAVDEFLADGHQARLSMYAARNHKLREGLRMLGMRSYTSNGNEAHSIVTCSLPPGLTFKDLYEPMKSAGYVIYDCKAPLAGKFFQIANMGWLADDTLDSFLVAFGACIRSLTPMAVETRPLAVQL